MTTLKCKMCGGDLELTPDVSVAECPYCGTKQTVPNADNEKKMTLFSRANRLRFNCEFDKAAGVYETIVAEFPEEAEAYWGLVLCKYGIEYVDDPATGKKIPTCHRSSFDSVMEDENFELATEYADTVARRVYREEAKQIEEIRKGIIEVSAKEEPYDIFICYKETDENGGRTIDSVLAQDIYDALTDEGYRVFFSRITLEDKLGQEYEPYIFAALHSARVMLAIGTSYDNYDAVWVKNEWSRYLQLIASGEKKTLIPCYKNLDAYDMPKEFAKLQAQDMGKVGAIQDLLRGIRKIIGKESGKSETISETASASGMAVLNAQTASLLKRGQMALEAGEYTRADEFFEQVLNNDAECVQAYRGKVFAAYKVRTVEAFVEKLWDKLEKDEKGKEICVKLNLSELARKADTQTHLFSDFTDEELEQLMESEFGDVSLCYDSYRDYYERKIFLGKLVNKPDFDRVLRYENNEMKQEVDQICKSLQERLNQKIQFERFKPLIVERRQAAKKKQIEETVAGWLLKSGEICEEREKKRQEKAESKYQAAIAAQNAAYQERLRIWEQEKSNYDAAYSTFMARQTELQGKIAQLEREKAELKGFFIGGKRREIEKNIAVLQNSLSAMVLPQEPEEKPVREALPERASFAPSAVSDSKSKKISIKTSIFPSFRAGLEALRKASVGEKVYFGKYPFTKKGDIQKLQWRVLEKKNGSVLLLTEEGIDAKPYNDKKVDITWEHCTLRKWLNGEFIDQAFTDTERMLIQDTMVDNSKTQGYRGYDTNGGNNTLDRVFLLSNKEAFINYFTSNADRICSVTEYAKQQGAYTNGGACWWWLRSPGCPQRNAANVYYDGSRDNGYVDIDNGCVRPALWINLDSDIF